MEKHKGNEYSAFILHHEVPTNKILTYLNIFFDIHLLKTEIYLAELAIRGYLIYFPFPITTQIADMINVNTQWNRFLCNTNKCYVSFNLRVFNINSFLPFSEYVRINAALNTKESMDHYNSSPFPYKKFLYVCINKAFCIIHQL